MKNFFPIFLFSVLLVYCQPESLPVIKGRVVFAGDTTQGVANTFVEVLSQSDTYQTVVNPDGTFEVSVQPGEYTVRPFKSQVPKMFGLDTLDYPIIQKFVIETYTFPTQWQWMAADITEDNRISTYDALTISGVMAGHPAYWTLLPGGVNNIWWVFVPDSYSSPGYNGFDIPPYPRTLTVDVAGDDVEVKFVGFVKGDVNMSADPQQ